MGSKSEAEQVTLLPTQNRKVYYSSHGEECLGNILAIINIFGNCPWEKKLGLEVEIGLILPIPGKSSLVLSGGCLVTN